MHPLICQINAIAKVCESFTEGWDYRDSELLSIRKAFRDATDRIDSHLDYRRVLRSHPGRHSEETE